jgi:hypothetical protein
MLTVFASALGPQLMAQWHTRTGSYVGILYGLAVAIGFLGLTVVLTPLPKTKTVPTEKVSFVVEPIPAGD